MSAVLISLPEVTVATSGSEQRLAAAAISNVVKVIVSSKSGNTGNAWIGDSDVAVGRGVEIVKGTSMEFFVDGELIDIYNMYVDVATSGDKVGVAYYKKV